MKTFLDFVEMSISLISPSYDYFFVPLVCFVVYFFKERTYIIYVYHENLCPKEVVKVLSGLKITAPFVEERISRIGG